MRGAIKKPPADASGFVESKVKKPPLDSISEVCLTILTRSKAIVSAYCKALRRNPYLNWQASSSSHHSHAVLYLLRLETLFYF